MENVDTQVGIFGKSKWVWADDATRKNSNIILRRTFSFPQDKKPPVRAVCRAACDSHYFLFVNGVAVVWCGGLNRGKSAYYDEFDIAKYLTKGDNVIVCYCQYYGNDGRDVTSSGRAGFIFECEELGIYSDASFTVYTSRAYNTPAASDCCYAGYGVSYDASQEGQIQNVLDPAFNSSLFVPATELAEYPDAVMGELLPRPIPLERFSPQPVIVRPRKISDKFGEDKYVITLPKEMRVTPYMEITGNGQERVTVETDRTACMGCFGDETSVYHAHSVEYFTKPTLNVFECMLPMTGSSIVFSMPKTVKVLKLGYREIGYNSVPTCAFDADETLDAMFKKACNTLYCSLGSTVMDTPERDRCMWLGDLSIASRALYLAYFDAASIVKKALDDIFDYSTDNVLHSCVPGSVPVDIPAHGLLALGEYGVFAQYRNFIGDPELFRLHYETLCEYLMLWNMTESGVELRDGTRRWYDNAYNTDDAIIENALYYSACKFVKEIALSVGEDGYDEEFEDRMANIAEYIESAWDGLGYTSREDCYDDRANALVVLAGLVPEDRYDAVARILSSVRNSSPYLEWTVTEALCALGKRELARKRFDLRNALDVMSDKTVLGEDVMGFGTDCQSYRSSAIFEAIQCFGGIDVRDGAKKITITPDFGAVKDFKVLLKLVTGELEVRYKYSAARIDIIIENRTTADVALEITPENIGKNVERRSIKINKGKNKFAI